MRSMFPKRTNSKPQTDGSRYLFSEKKTIEEVQGYCASNAKDIIAIGFDPAKTFIFSDVCSAS